MRALVVYESMYGNTHAIADAIAEGIRATGEVRVVPVADAAPQMVVWADLVIVGGPTHAHGMSTSGSRKSAVESAAKPDGWSEVSLDPAAEGLGIREWFESVGDAAGKPAAAFDTRAKAPAILTGRASSGIAKGLRSHGFRLLVDPESFLVDTHQRLIGGEMERATAWGANLAARLSEAVPAGSR
jgi:hypothetical protein